MAGKSAALGLLLCGVGLPITDAPGATPRKPAAIRHDDRKTSAARAAAAARARLAEQRRGAAAALAKGKAAAAQAKQEAERAARRADADAQRASLLSARTVQATTAVQNTDKQAADAAERLQSLAAQRASLHDAMARDVAALTPMLPVMERLALYPSETLLAAPSSPDDALTGLSVLRGLGAELERHARGIRDAQDRLDILENEVRHENDRLSALRQQQKRQQDALAAQTRIAAAAQIASGRAADQMSRRAAAAAARATTLDDALARLSAAEEAEDRRLDREAEAARRAALLAERAPAPVRQRADDAARKARDDAAEAAVPAGAGLGSPADGAAPVQGPVAVGFGGQTEAGPAQGVRYAPPPHATVSAPCAGRVVFSGPFRSYGNMMILDCGRGDRFVLAGLERIDAPVGGRVARGAAIGRMPDWSPGAGGGRPSLYVQLRHGDRAVDPTRFLQGGR
ncbi:murein hydrolase activator EnvC family protein [Rhizosaccharibacter radicis]|uniref:Peptidoglycan DD-metalloendopeptidase family protein n=1 Tax=Rhizosaccharibacter radicis TaxID=2782605 RepID=A0ABT1VXE2_9PROT|nr:peptidoglycan DD-metalloendopeptidase family protein [Acetobacteraceae bacterium KSS12]